jgi:acyl carrier protein
MSCGRDRVQHTVNTAGSDLAVRIAQSLDGARGDEVPKAERGCMGGTMVNDTIRRFIVKDLHWNGSTEGPTDDYDLLRNEVLDSMGIFEIVSFVENEFEIEILDEDLLPDNFETIGSIARLVESKRASENTPSS